MLSAANHGSSSSSEDSEADSDECVTLTTCKLALYQNSESGFAGML